MEHKEFLLTLELLMDTGIAACIGVLICWCSYCLYHHIPDTGSLKKELIRPWPIRIALAIWLIGGIGLALLRFQLRQGA